MSNAFGWCRSESVELATWSAVLFASTESSGFVVAWNDAAKGMPLQETTSLYNPQWQDVPGSEATNAMHFERTRAAAFFRLVVRPPSDRLIWVPPGTFLMGSPEAEVDRWGNEGPQTTVTITRGFWMGKCEVTQGEYLEVMGSNPSWFTGESNMPVQNVRWQDAVGYCAALAARERAAGKIPGNCLYRLPTEAEWEYACRAGTSTRFSYGDDPGYTILSNYAWYSDNSEGTTHPVGEKLPNPWGFHDMHGNVWEWCSDWYGDYVGRAITDPRGPATGSRHVIRGGHWLHDATFCRSANRIYDLPFRSDPYDYEEHSARKV